MQSQNVKATLVEFCLSHAHKLCHTERRLNWGKLGEKGCATAGHWVPVVTLTDVIGGTGHQEKAVPQMWNQQHLFSFASSSTLYTGQKRPSATGRKAVAGPFMNQSGKLQRVKRGKFWWLRARLSRFSRGCPQTGPFGPFLGPGGSGADPKTPIWPLRENCWWKWVQPN